MYHLFSIHMICFHIIFSVVSKMKKLHVLWKMETVEITVTQVLESISKIDFQKSFEVLIDRFMCYTTTPKIGIKIF